MKIILNLDLDNPTILNLNGQKLDTGIKDLGTPPLQEIDASKFYRVSINSASIKNGTNPVLILAVELSILPSGNVKGTLQSAKLQK